MKLNISNIWVLRDIENVQRLADSIFTYKLQRQIWGYEKKYMTHWDLVNERLGDEGEILVELLVGYLDVVNVESLPEDVLVLFLPFLKRILK